MGCGGKFRSADDLKDPFLIARTTSEVLWTGKDSDGRTDGQGRTSRNSFSQSEQIEAWPPTADLDGISKLATQLGRIETSREGNSRTESAPNEVNVSSSWRLLKEVFSPGFISDSRKRLKLGGG